MSTSNKLPGVDQRLKNVANALYLTTSNNVAIRTGIEGDVIINGPVSIPGTVTVDSSESDPVHVHVTELSSGTVSLSTATLSALENITVQNNVTATITSMPPFTGTATVYQGTTPWVVTSTATDITIADSTYEMNVARGLLGNQSSVERSAYIPATPNLETSIWVEGGIYPHGTWTSPSVLYVASSSASDTGQTIYIEGLDSNYNPVTATVTTNGTTTVSTTQTFIRIFTATITNASNNSANAGDIRFRIGSASGTIVAHIGIGLGVTKLSQYTVPAGYTAYILYGDVATFKNGAGNQSGLVKMMVRPFGGAFIAAFIAQVSNGYYRNDFKIPLKVPAKADIDVRILTDATGATVSSNYQMILVPN